MVSFEKFLDGERRSNNRRNRILDNALFILNAAEIRHNQEVDYAISHPTGDETDESWDEGVFFYRRRAAGVLDGLRRGVMGGDQEIIERLSYYALSPHVSDSLEDVQEIAYNAIKHDTFLLEVYDRN